MRTRTTIWWPTTTKETTSTVDIGFHYVATDSSGIPLDYDGDGLPDYYEDQNGDGFAQITETDWEDQDTDNDGVNDFLEGVQGRDPLINNTSSDSMNQNQLRVFTPLK